MTEEEKLMRTQDYADAVLWLQRIDAAKKELKEIEAAAKATLSTDAGQLARIHKMETQLRSI